MFYLKYRPKTFAQVIGLDAIVQTLQKFLSQSTLPHAYLFIGPRGSGKTTTARLLAKALNCQKPLRDDKGLEVCDECSNCQEISQGRFLDLIEIDAASNRGIDDIRFLREKIKLAPSGGRFKVYIIDEVHMLTLEAFNALLKTLEEPPSHAIFILATTEPQKIPETIKSRCHVFNFKRASQEDLLAKLNQILDREGVKIDPAQLVEIARAAEGGFRDAETLLEQLVAGFSQLRPRSFDPNTFVDLLATHQTQAALVFISEIHQSGFSLPTFTQDLLYYLRDLLLVKSGLAREDLTGLVDSFEKLEVQAQRLSVEEVNRFLNAFLKASQDAKIVSIAPLPLEMAVLSVLPRTSSLGDHSSPVTSQPSLSKEPSSVPEPDLEAGRSPELSDKENPELGFSLTEVESHWPQILKEVKPANHSLEALLRSARPKELVGGRLILEVFYKFHQERLSAQASLDILENVFARVLGTPIKVACILGEPKSRVVVEDLNSDEDIKAAALRAFVGE